MNFSVKKSRKTTVPKRRRRESSPTALKAAVKTGGLSNPHKGKRSNEAEALKTKDKKVKRCTVPMISAGKHGRLQKAVV